VKTNCCDQVDFCPFRGPDAPFALWRSYHERREVDTHQYCRASPRPAPPPGEATPWHRDPFHRVTVMPNGNLLEIDKKQNLTFSAYFFYIAEQMNRGELLGLLEHIILLALARLDGGAHGMIVRREIEERTGRNTSIGAVYATLERLEAKEYVSLSANRPQNAEAGQNGCFASRLPASGHCKYRSKHFAA
jgi:hypothetical protein